LPYPDEYFDLITAFEVLEHTESIEKTLRKIVHKFRVHGYLLIEVPIIVDNQAGKIFHALDRDPSHIGILPRKELFSIIQHMGLEMLE
jgi:2-polyprenyl-3-methyl-5-hydroxy-6-metoxy-1,4-benzoquinol methylase